jgi:hypothetical protein
MLTNATVQWLWADNTICVTITTIPFHDLFIIPNQNSVLHKRSLPIPPLAPVPGNHHPISHLCEFANSECLKQEESYLFFYIWLISLSIMSSRSSQVVAAYLIHSLFPVLAKHSFSYLLVDF